MREKFYEQRLLLGRSWYCDSPPTSRLVGDGRVLVDWTFVWQPPPSTDLDPKVLVLGPDRGVSFETPCADFEKEFCRRSHDLVCECCALATEGQKCKSCMHSTVSECDDKKDDTEDEDPSSEEGEENTPGASGYKAARAQWAGASERSN